jgi:hypothetical protein
MGFLQAAFRLRAIKLAAQTVNPGLIGCQRGGRRHGDPARRHGCCCWTSLPPPSPQHRPLKAEFLGGLRQQPRAIAR